MSQSTSASVSISKEEMDAMIRDVVTGYMIIFDEYKGMISGFTLMFAEFAGLLKFGENTKLAKEVVAALPEWTWESENGGFRSEPDIKEIVRKLNHILNGTYLRHDYLPTPPLPLKAINPTFTILNEERQIDRIELQKQYIYSQKDVGSNSYSAPAFVPDIKYSLWANFCSFVDVLMRNTPEDFRNSFVNFTYFLNEYGDTLLPRVIQHAVPIWDWKNPERGFLEPPDMTEIVKNLRHIINTY